MRIKRIVNYCLLSSLIGFSCCGGCGESAPREVVVFTTVDRELGKAILDKFQQQTSIVVRTNAAASSFDSGSPPLPGGSGGGPPTDVVWSEEIQPTLQLQQQGQLRPLKSPASKSLPDSGTHLSKQLWHSVAARARVLIVNTNQVPEERRPKSIRDLADPQWYERCGIAKPLTGTSATQAACLYAAWGEGEAKEFFQNVKRNARILANNEEVAKAVAANSLAFGITDCDVALAEVERGMPVAIIYPDQGEGQLGTLFIPSTVAVLKNAPHPEQATELAEYLLSEDVEKRLGDRFGEEKTPADIRAMEVDWTTVAAKWDLAAALMKVEFAVP
jgi:iron(III) transport system substrate-binding protein